MQVDTKHSDYQLRGVLHAIATQPQIEPCINLILQAALDQTDAVGAAFHSSDSLALNVAVGTSEMGGLDFTTLPDQPDALQYFAEGRLLAQSVRVPDRYYGVLLLTFAKAHEADDAEREFIVSLAESLAIVAAHAEQRSTARISAVRRLQCGRSAADTGCVETVGIGESGSGSLVRGRDGDWECAG